LKGFLYWLNYFDAPVVKEKQENFLVLESIRNKVWNPVFTVGVITFVLSMTLRGFFNQYLAVFPLGISTLILFSGIWILSSVAIVVFDKNESKIYFVYKHLGYLQKVYTFPLSSFEEVELVNGEKKMLLQLAKDDGTFIKVASRKEKKMIGETASTIASFLNLPLKSL